MSIGEALAHARRQAGLTVTEVSQRTRIRAAIIAGIEADDYAACGGDFYARGHIRAIARVAGIDSEPLIEEYDAARRPPPQEPDQFSAPSPTGRRGRWGRGGGAAYDSGAQGGSAAQGGSGAQGGGAQGGRARGGDLAQGDSSGFGGSAARSRRSGLGGWLGRGGRDRWDDDQQAGLDEADRPEPETERWPGLGWLGRGYRSDPDGWDEQPRHDGADQAYEQEPGHRADWNEPGQGGPYRWDDAGQADQGRRGQAADPPPESQTSATWHDPAHIDPDHWDEQLASDRPAQAYAPDPETRADWSEPDPGDTDHWDKQLAQEGPDQTDEPEPRYGSGWSDAPIDPDHWDEELAHDGPGQPGEPRPGWTAADPSDPDSWDAGQLGRGRTSGAGRRGGLGAWIGLGDRDGGRPWRGQMVATWVVLAAVIGFAIYSFVFAAGHRTSAAGPHRSHTLQAAARHHPRHKSPSPSVSPSATPTPAVPLRPASATAFGIGGTGRGDDAGQAGLAIDHNPATAWHTDWYTSARFGNLYSGTGLLVDMGHPVTIASARVTLGPARGAGLALRVGSIPTLTGLHTAATASNAGGVVNLNPSSPVRGRYVLIWMTNLPRDSAGTYQAYIFNIQLTGHP